MRSVFPQLIGNDRFRSITGGDVLAGRLGHAFILEGPKGSGKRTAARLTAAALSCENRANAARPLPCDGCLACRKIREGISPDVITVKREEDRATLGVEAIRKLREDLCIAPNENEAKVYIIEDADKMTVQAQNALLLSLEEPPPYVVFFLLTEDASALLETIRSRAPVLRMQQFDCDKLAQILREDPRFETIARTRADFFADAVLAANGAIGRAQEILSGNSADAEALLSLRADALRITAHLFTNDAAEAAKLLFALPKDRADVVKLFDYVLTALRDLASAKKTASLPLLLYPSKSDCKAAADKITLSRIIGAYDDVFRARQDILANASVQTVAVALLTNKH